MDGWMGQVGIQELGTVRCGAVRRRWREDRLMDNSEELLEVIQVELES